MVPGSASAGFGYPCLGPESPNSLRQYRSKPAAQLSGCGWGEQALWGGGREAVCGLSYEFLERSNVSVLKLLEDRWVSDGPLHPLLRRTVGCCHARP